MIRVWNAKDREHKVGPADKILQVKSQQTKNDSDKQERFDSYLSPHILLTFNKLSLREDVYRSSIVFFYQKFQMH